ncbi:MAG: hypothetical protein ACYCUV_05070 [Phycisphaerae bacterium]
MKKRRGAGDPQRGSVVIRNHAGGNSIRRGHEPKPGPEPTAAAAIPELLIRGEFSYHRGVPRSNIVAVEVRKRTIIIILIKIHNEFDLI